MSKVKVFYKVIDMTASPRTLPAGYLDARNNFIFSSQSTGAQYEHHILSGISGPGGEDLSIDVARFGPPDASRLLITTSGIHGVEAPLGSALQTQWLNAAYDLPTDLAVLHVHTLNPWGYAHGRRYNENNIDLNRCFVEKFPVPHDAGHPYHILAPHLSPAGLAKPFSFSSWWGLRVFVVRHSFLKGKPFDHGKKVLRDGLMRGQYDYPDGMYFGGNAITATRKIWQDIIVRHARQARRIVHLDLHTGLGPRGVVEIIVDAPEDDARLGLADKIWQGEKVTVLGGHGVHESASALTVGTLADFWKFMPVKNPDKVLAITLETGTVSEEKVFRALCAEHAAYHNNVPESVQAVARQRLRDVFAPPEPDWAQAALAANTRIFESLLQNFPN